MTDSELLSLKWSAQLSISLPSLADPRSNRLRGDKIILPQSALEALLNAPRVAPNSHGVDGGTSSGDGRDHQRSVNDRTRPYPPVTPAPTSYSDLFSASNRVIPTTLPGPDRDSIHTEANHEQQYLYRQPSQHQRLPHPLMFRLVNPDNGRVAYAGVREFSAEEGEVGMSPFLVSALGLPSGLEDGEFSQQRSGSSSPGEDGRTDGVEKADAAGSFSKPATITIHAQQLPKGKYVRLRPLEAGYDPEDWKSLLERHLRDTYTTLTRGEVLAVPGPHRETFKFLVDEFEPKSDGVCIIDTDLEVDIEPLSEEQARESLNQKLAKSRKTTGLASGTSEGGALTLGTETHGQVLPGGCVDFQLSDWNRQRDLEVRLETASEEGLLDLLISPLSAKQRAVPRPDRYVFGDLDSRSTKRLKLSHTNVDVEEAESLTLAVHCWKQESHVAGHEHDNGPVSFTLTASLAGAHDREEGDRSAVGVSEVGTDEVKCKNCKQQIPTRTLPLHEAFCYRNNVSCPRCGDVFLKNSPAWRTHWHCSHDDGSHGNGVLSKLKHDSLFHPASPLSCPDCSFRAYDMPILAAHRTTTCPRKEILCQFCHLVVPQQGPDDPPFTDAEVLLSGLTPHELTDGARTTECHLCHKIVRLRDMRTHMRFHDRDRLSRPKPRLCINPLCGLTIAPGGDEERRVTREQLNLCDDCFAPLYITSHDPEGKALRRRVERRLLQQLIGGCGKSWCHNAEWCRTGQKNSTGEDRTMTTKDALPVIRPVLEGLTGGPATNLRLCVGEAAQTGRATAEMMAAEGTYELEWCAKGLQESSKGGHDVSRARGWLADHAPKIGEVAV